MQHPDEHTLALFALSGEQDSAEREAIASHIASCAGCRAQFEELLGINQSVAESLATRAVPVVRNVRGLATRRSVLTRHFDATPARSARFPESRLVRFTRYVRRHPAGSASLMLMGALAVILTVNEAQKKSMTVPAEMRWNDQGTAIEIMDRKGMLLWDLPVHDIGDGTLSVERWGNSLTRIVDLDGDGRTEVVTGEPYSDGDSQSMNVVRSYDGRGTLLAQITIGHSIAFRGDTYPMFFSITGIVTIKRPGGPSMEVIAGASGNRSPYVVTRLDRSGAIVGEYWHYGWIPALTGASIEGEANKSLVLCGVNNVGDKSDSGFAAIAILDPSRITGLTESLASRGFGYVASEAELYYIKAEVPTLPFLGDSSVHVGNFRKAKVAQDSSLVFIYQSGTASGLPSYTYTFDHSLHLLSVSFDNISRQVLQGKYLHDKSAAVLDRYRRTLEEGVRYWDGERWRREPTRVGRRVAVAP